MEQLTAIRLQAPGNGRLPYGSPSELPKAVRRFNTHTHPNLENYLSLLAHFQGISGVQHTGHAALENSTHLTAFSASVLRKISLPQILSMQKFHGRKNAFSRCRQWSTVRCCATQLPIHWVGRKGGAGEWARGYLLGQP